MHRETEQTRQTLSSFEISFSNGNRAHAVRAQRGSIPSDILRQLGIQQPKALILIIGGAASIDKLDEQKKSRLPC